jgi:hypothetical protein
MELLRSIVSEQHVQVKGLDLTLKDIVKNGKVSDPYQLLVLGQLSEFFKNGLKSADLELEHPISFDSAATTTAVKTALMGMSDAEHVALAKYLLNCVDAGECMLHHKESNIIDWMRFVLAHQM